MVAKLSLAFSSVYKLMVYVTIAHFVSPDSPTSGEMEMYARHVISLFKTAKSDRLYHSFVRESLGVRKKTEFKFEFVRVLTQLKQAPENEKEALRLNLSELIYARIFVVLNELVNGRLVDGKPDHATTKCLVNNWKAPVPGAPHVPVKGMDDFVGKMAMVIAHFVAGNDAKTPLMTFFTCFATESPESRQESYCLHVVRLMPEFSNATKGEINKICPLTKIHDNTTDKEKRNAVTRINTILNIPTDRNLSSPQEGEEKNRSRSFSNSPVGGIEIDLFFEGIDPDFEGIDPGFEGIDPGCEGIDSLFWESGPELEISPTPQGAAIERIRERVRLDAEGAAAEGAAAEGDDLAFLAAFDKPPSPDAVERQKMRDRLVGLV